MVNKLALNYPGDKVNILSEPISSVRKVKRLIPIRS